jgi:hypothetical protein
MILKCFLIKERTTNTNSQNQTHDSGEIMNKSKVLAAMGLAIFVSNSLVFGQQQWEGAQDFTGNIFRAGNVGIGTQTPTAMLHLKNPGGLPSLFFEGDTASLAVLKICQCYLDTGTVWYLPNVCASIRAVALALEQKENLRRSWKLKAGGDKSTLRVYAYPRPDDPDDPIVLRTPDLTR